LHTADLHEINIRYKFINTPVLLIALKNKVLTKKASWRSNLQFVYEYK
jgi:hypothetical protein